VNAYLIVSSLINFAAALVLALTAFVTARRNFGSLSFGGLALSVGVWSGAYCLWRLTDSAGSALMLCRILMVGATFIPITMLHFAFVVTGISKRPLLLAGYACALVLAVLDFTPTIVASVDTVGGLKFWPHAGPLFAIFLVFFFGCITASVVLLLSANKGLGTTRGHRHMVVWVLTIACLGGSTNFPMWYGIPIPPVGNGLIFVYLCVLGFAVTKYRLPHLQTDLVKSAAFLGISTVVGGLYGLIWLAVQHVTMHPVTTNELTAQFFYGVLVTAIALWAVPVMVELAEKFLERSMLKERYRLRRELKDLLRAIGAEHEETAIFVSAAHRLAEVFRAHEVAIYFRGEMEPAMRLRATAVGTSCVLQIEDGNPVVAALSAHPSSHSLGHLATAGAPWGWKEMAALRALGFELAVPMVAEGRLTGVILLDRPEGVRDDSDTVLSMLEAVSLQLALTVTARRLERRANQSEKLIALGTLSAGLAHELRNPLTSIQTFLALSERGVNPGQDPGFLRIVQRDATRITSIIENVSVFASNAQVAMSPVQLDQVLSSTVEIAQEESAAAHIRTLLDCRVQTPIRGNYGQLQQVFVNLVQNAIQAIGPNAGEIQLVAESIVLPSGEPGARVLVRDTGPGVAPEVLSRIFEPFVTTKATGDRTGKRGMGLGLAIVKRIIEAHDGAIRVESTPGKGTQFFVYLPACRNQ